jgi:hypothetical protein
VSYGTTKGGSYTSKSDVGKVTSATLTVPNPTATTTYYFVARAYDANKSVYSAYSNEVSQSITVTTTTDSTPPSTPGSLTATAASSSQINLSWTASTDNVGVEGYRVESCQGSGCTNFIEIATPTGTTFSNSGLASSTTYRFRVRAADANNFSGYSPIASATTQQAATGSQTPPSSGSGTSTAGGCTSNCTIWPATAVPKTVDDGDRSATEVGVKFKSDVGGKISAIRFYKGSANTGTHVGNLWSANGTRLASATFTNETSSGWQQVNFATPVTISANTVYVASYHTTVGRYSADESGLASAVDRPPLHALADGASGANGLYGYASAGTFPTMTWRSANYWVDVVFTPSAPTSDTTNLALNKPATASSESSSTYTASKAFDGSTSTRWSSLAKDPQWLRVDLGARYNIARVKLVWSGSYASSYKIQVCNEVCDVESNWREIYSTTKGAGGTVDLTSGTGVGRFVRMYGTSRGTSYGYSLSEMEVYGTPWQ